MLKKIAIASLAPLSLTSLMMAGLPASAKTVKTQPDGLSQGQTKSREGKMAERPPISNKFSAVKHPTSHQPKTQSQKPHQSAH